MSKPTTQSFPGKEFLDTTEEISIAEVYGVLRKSWLSLTIAPLVLGCAALGATYLIKPTFTAKTVFLPPQQQQSSASAALASLGSLANLAGTSAKNSGDQIIALMQSLTISNRIIQKFNLQEIYEAKLLSSTQKVLETKVRLALGKKDGLISLEVDDSDPDRAAAIANQYIEELRQLTSALAVTEAQQRRVFFEKQLQQNQQRLIAAQIALQSSGFSAGALKSEPKAAAEAYARLKAEATAAEIKLQTMSVSLNDAAPEVRQARTALGAVRAQISKLEASNAPTERSDSDYISKYREFKYQETLFDLFSRQFELAKVDESREGALIQVIDEATPPDRKSKPSRALYALSATATSAVLMAVYLLARHFASNRRRHPVAKVRNPGN